MKFYFGKMDKNSHGTEKSGEPWNKEMRRGPKFILVRLGYKPNYTGWRLIYYFKSGAWWYWDASTFKGQSK